MGNFLFDQRRGNTVWGVIVKAVFTRKSVDIDDIIPVKINNFIPEIAEGNEKRAILSKIKEISPGLDEKLLFPLGNHKDID